MGEDGLKLGLCGLKIDHKIRPRTWVTGFSLVDQGVADPCQLLYLSTFLEGCVIVAGFKLGVKCWPKGLFAKTYLTVRVISWKALRNMFQK